MMKGKKKRPRNPIAVALRERHPRGQITMRDRRERRLKDTRNHWMRDES